MNLYVVYVGGMTAASLIEVHDIHFAIAETLNDTFDQLKNQWWGTAASLHIDAYGILKSVESCHLELKTTSSNSKLQLYFLNLGGYDNNQFTELHKNMFVIAESPEEAK